MNGSNRTTNTGSSLIDLFSGLCGGYVKLDIINNNDIALSQNKSIKGQRKNSRAKDKLISGHKNDHVIEKWNGSVSVKKENAEKHKAVDGIERFRVVCNFRNCLQLFESFDAMIYHHGRYHERGTRKKFSCHLCKKTVQTFRTIRKHLEAIHVRHGRFSCPFATCSKSSCSKAAMQHHVNGAHTKEVAYECTKCSYQSYYQQILKQHSRRIHSGAAAFRCSRVTAESQRKSRKETSFKCPIEPCPKSFRAKYSLQQHVNAKHTKKIGFYCTQCAFISYYKCSLVKHMAVKHREVYTTAANNLNMKMAHE